MSIISVDTHNDIPMREWVHLISKMAMPSSMLVRYFGKPLNLEGRRSWLIKVECVDDISGQVGKDHIIEIYDGATGSDSSVSSQATEEYEYNIGVNHRDAHLVFLQLMDELRLSDHSILDRNINIVLSNPERFSDDIVDVCRKVSDLDPSEYSEDLFYSLFLDIKMAAANISPRMSIINSNTAKIKTLGKSLSNKPNLDDIYLDSQASIILNNYSLHDGPLGQLESRIIDSVQHKINTSIGLSSLKSKNNIKK